VDIEIQQEEAVVLFVEIRRPSNTVVDCSGMFAAQNAKNQVPHFTGHGSRSGG
jgi:hypothetical protein